MGTAVRWGSVGWWPGRWGWVSVLLVLALAAPAHADPRALARSAGVLAIAPGGDQVLVARARGAHLRVVSIPLAGGAARPVFSFDAPEGMVYDADERLRVIDLSGRSR